MEVEVKDKWGVLDHQDPWIGSCNPEEIRIRGPTFAYLGFWSGLTIREMGWTRNKVVFIRLRQNSDSSEMIHILIHQRIRAVVVGFFPCRHVAKVKICCQQNCRQKLLTNWSKKSSISGCLTHNHSNSVIAIYRRSPVCSNISFCMKSRCERLALSSLFDDEFK